MNIVHWAGYENKLARAFCLLDHCKGNIYN
jgi:hypothetical protein